MKKFKFKSKKSNLKIIIIFLFIIIVFLLLSTIKLAKSNKKLINYLLNDFDNSAHINILTSNLSYLLNSYYFKEENNSRDIAEVYNKDLLSNVFIIENDEIDNNNDKVNNST